MQLQIRNLSKSFLLPDGTERLVVDIPSLEIGAGEKIGVFGPSGSGKSTFLNLLSGMATPTSGEIFAGDTALHQLDESQRDRFRGRFIGYIFQNFHLFSGYSVLENVLMGMLFSGVKPDKKTAFDLLGRVGLNQRLHDKPSQLSTGQRQRVAIARALAHNPSIILADEPTGNLDPANTTAILDLLFEISQGKTLITVTHEADVLHRFQRTIALTPVVEGAQ
jgi:ABC-type lipoprotein export system ATPase subunit